MKPPVLVLLAMQVLVLSQKYQISACKNETLTQAVASERASATNTKDGKTTTKSGTFRGYLSFMLLCEPDTHCIPLSVKSDIIKCLEFGQSMAALYLYKQCTAQGTVTCDDQAMTRTVRNCLRLQGSVGNLITDASRQCIREKVTLGHLDCYKINQKLRTRGQQFWSHRPPSPITGRPDIGALFTTIPPSGNYGYHYNYRTSTRRPFDPNEQIYQPYPPNLQTFPNNPNQPGNYPPNQPPPGYPPFPPGGGFPLIPIYPPQGNPFDVERFQPNNRNQDQDDSEEDGEDFKEEHRPIKRKPRTRRPLRSAAESGSLLDNPNAKRLINTPTRRPYVRAVPTRRVVYHRGFETVAPEEVITTSTALTADDGDQQEAFNEEYSDKESEY